MHYCRKELLTQQRSGLHHFGIGAPCLYHIPGARTDRRNGHGAKTGWCSNRTGHTSRGDRKSAESLGNSELRAQRSRGNQRAAYSFRSNYSSTQGLRRDRWLARDARRDYDMAFGSRQSAGPGESREGHQEGKSSQQEPTHGNTFHATAEARALATSDQTRDTLQRYRAKHRRIQCLCPH